MTTQHPSLLDTDQEILKLLTEDGRQTPSMMLSEIESTESRQYIQNRLQHLREHDLVHRPDRGIYEVTERGRTAAENLNLYNHERDAFWDRVDN